MTETSQRVAADKVEQQCALILGAWGMDEGKVRTTARLMAETDLRGIDSHGISMLILYDQMFATGQLRLSAEPIIERESASTALIDAQAGLGHPVAVMAMEMAIEKAKRADIGVVSVFNSHHFGAAGLYAEMAAKAGMIGIISCTTKVVTVVPTFGAQRQLGTNPFAFAAPTTRHPIVLLDMSTSVVAANKVKAYALRGEELPQGWVSDVAGNSVTDSPSAYDLLFKGREGGLAPHGGVGMALGGHKGYGLAIFAQILSSTLSGGSFSPVRNRSQRPGDGDNIGQYFQVINPEAFRPRAEFEADLDALIDELRATRPANPDVPVMIPGDPEWASRQDKLINGIPMAPDLLSAVRDIATRAGAPFVLDTF
jgi:LDH2 family malate/lactate/ureidoglycolate dehydrogenase